MEMVRTSDRILPFLLILAIDLHDAIETRSIRARKRVGFDVKIVSNGQGLLTTPIPRLTISHVAITCGNLESAGDKRATVWIVND